MLAGAIVQLPGSVICAFSIFRSCCGMSGSFCSPGVCSLHILTTYFYALASTSA